MTGARASRVSLPLLVLIYCSGVGEAGSEDRARDVPVTYRRGDQSVVKGLMAVGDDGDMWETHAVNRLLARVRGVVWRMSRGSGSRMAERR